MKAESTVSSCPSDNYPGMKVLKTRNVCNYINRFAYEQEKNDNIFQFERVDNKTCIIKNGWFDRIFNFTKRWVEEDLA